MKKLTPAQQQYHDLKQENPGFLLLFRMGDFYETFHEDAAIAHKVLGITLTARDKKSDEPVPMAGIPYHALEKYLPKLIKAGHKVAIAEQVGEVVPGSVVAREVTQRITPGTWIGGDELICEIVSVRNDGEKFWIAIGDATVGNYQTGSFATIESLIERLEGRRPNEIVMDMQCAGKKTIEEWASHSFGGVMTTHTTPSFPESYLQGVLQTNTIDGYGQALEGGSIYAASLLFDYLKEIQHSCAIHTIGSLQSGTAVRLDPLTIRNLELFQSQYEGTKEHSLLAVIDACSSALGSRYLFQLLRQPTSDTKKISMSHARIQQRLHSNDRKEVQMLLSKLSDISKTPARASRGYDPKKILTQIRNDAQEVLLHEKILGIHMPSQELTTRLEALVSGTQNNEERFFSYGYDTNLDELYKVTQSVDAMLLQYHQQIVAHTKINGIRIKYTNTQGYCLETSKKDAAALMEKATKDDLYAFYPRQSLKSAERFGTPYLADLESKIQQAQQDYELRFNELIQKLIDEFLSMQKYRYERCEILAEHDVAMMASQHIAESGWSLPLFSDSGDCIIKGGFHPVVKKYLSYTDQFIPNDLTFTKGDTFHCITGPNMGGKSTYLRQNALIILLAHCGLPVPAESATVSYVDGIYARVGSGDALAKNQSTFMTEMIEMANIINNATKNSFIVLDELGRGTSTYDGMALAYALTVNICQMGSKTLFATHYHELIGLEDEMQGFSNWQVGVIEKENEVVFLKKILPGGADKSYGLHVASRAGIPNSIIADAEVKLKELIAKRSYIPQQETLFDKKNLVKQENKGIDEKIIKEINSCNVDELTPVDALVHIHQRKKQLSQVTSNDTETL